MLVGLVIVQHHLHCLLDTGWKGQSLSKPGGDSTISHNLTIVMIKRAEAALSHFKATSGNIQFSEPEKAVEKARAGSLRSADCGRSIGWSEPNVLGMEINGNRNGKEEAEMSQ